MNKIVLHLLQHNTTNFFIIDHCGTWKGLILNDYGKCLTMGLEAYKSIRGKKKHIYLSNTPFSKLIAQSIYDVNQN